MLMRGRDVEELVTLAQIRYVNWSVLVSTETTVSQDAIGITSPTQGL